MEDKRERISFLICRHILGTITDEELRELEAWRQEEPLHEDAFSRMTDPIRLGLECRRAEILDYRRPLADMKRRLNLDRQNNRLPVRTVAAAAVILLLIGTGVMLWRQKDKSLTKNITPVQTERPILPGRTQATLTLEGGIRVELGNDKADNEKAIAQATRGKEIVMNNLSTPRGGEFRLTLEDGTEVWLNTDSRLIYPENFNENERRVEVSGEAYFKVATDTERPFYVVSGGQEVRVYGTEFNVHAYNDEPDIYTTLVAGSIALRTVGGNNSEMMLAPGHQAIFDKTASTARVKAVDAQVATSWRTGVFVFEEQTLEQIMRTLSRWYDFTYEFADKKAAQTVFMGSIPRYSDFTDVVDIFRKMGGIYLHRKDGKVIISTQ